MKSTSEMDSLYDILHVSEQSTTLEIRNAWRAQMMNLKPELYDRDRTHAERISKAYRILTCKEQRNRYDEYVSRIGQLVKAGMNDYMDFEDFEEEDYMQECQHNLFSTTFSNFLTDYFKNFLNAGEESEHIQDEVMHFKHTVIIPGGRKSIRTITLKNGDINIQIKNFKKRFGFWMSL